MILYGRNPVREALRGRRASSVRDVWATPGAAREPWLQGVAVRVLAAEEIERRCGSAAHQGVCAEAGALSAMVLAGSTRVLALAVVGDGAGLVTPCGGCRQKLREFAAPDTPVLVADREQLRARFTLAQLLPESFGPEHLQS